MKVQNIILILLVGFLFFLPLFITETDEFGGTDDKGSQLVEEINPGYEPWFAKLAEAFSPAENLLFTLQAVIGSGILFYCIGYFKGKKKGANQ